MKKIICFLLVAAIVTVSVIGMVACADKNVIKLNEVTHSVFYAPMYVAIEQGYFKEEGLTVELTNGGGADKTMAALIAKEADIGFCGPEAAVYVKAQGSDNFPIVFGQLTQKDGSFLIGRKAEPDFEWGDLAGKEIIGGRKGGMPAMTLEYALKQNDMAIGKDVTLNYDVQFNLITAAFEGGTGDYCTMFEPGASQFEDSGKGYIIASVGKEAGAVPYTCFMATREYMEENSNKIEKFMSAIMKGIDYVSSHTDAEVAAAIEGSFPTTDLKLLEKSIKNYREIGAFVSDPTMTKESFEHMQDILIASGTLDTRVKYEDMIDNSFIENIKNQ